MWRLIISILTIIIISSISTEFSIFRCKVSSRDLPAFGVVISNTNSFTSFLAGLYEYYENIY